MIAQPQVSKPFTLTVVPAGVPNELAALDQWIGWRWELNKDDKWTKVPMSPNTGRKASTVDQATWSTFDHAVSEQTRRGWDGIGFVFTADDPYFGIDDDDSYGDDNKLRPDTTELIERFGTYAEPSVRFQGVHLIGKATSFPHTGGGNKKGRFECYWAGRYFAVTGRPQLGMREVADCTEQLQAWHAETFPVARVTSIRPPLPNLTLDDHEALARARHLPGFVALYEHGETGEYGGDHSRADLGLLNDLIRAGVTDPGQLDRLFRGSALNRAKWDARRGSETYGERTIRTALNGGTAAWDGWRGSKNGVDSPKRHLDVIPPADCAACAKKDREIAKLREQLDEERVARKDLQAKLDQLSGVHDWETNVRKNKGLAQKRATAVAVGHQLASWEDAGAFDDDGMHDIDLGTLGDSAGYSAGSVGAHLDDLRDAGLIRKHTYSIPGYIDATTGEIVPTTRKVRIGPPAGGVEAYRKATAAYKPEEPNNWGGKRIACPEHPKAGTVKKWRIHCKECDAVLAADEETHTKPDPDYVAAPEQSRPTDARNMAYAETGIGGAWLRGERLPGFDGGSVEAGP